MDLQSTAKLLELSIKMNGNFDDSDLSLQLQDEKYHCRIDGQLYPLATTLFERFPDKASKLLKLGGSVMAMCYALYNLGFYAYNFVPGTLSFTIGFDDKDKMASVKQNIESGKFHEVLWNKWNGIVDEHKQELGHLKKKSVAQDSTFVESLEVKGCGNVNYGQSGGVSMQQRDHGQMAKGNITNINNPRGPTTNIKNETRLSGVNKVVGSNVGQQNIGK